MRILDSLRIGYTLGSALDGVASARHLRRIRAVTEELDALFERLMAERRARPRGDVVPALVTECGGGKLTASAFPVTAGSR